MTVVITIMVLITCMLFVICWIMINIENNGTYKSINAQILTVPDNSTIEIKEKEESKYLNIKAMDLVVYMLKLKGIYSHIWNGYSERVKLIKYDQLFLCGYLYFITIDYYKKTGKYLLKEDFLTTKNGVIIEGLHEKYLDYIIWLDANKIPINMVPTDFIKEVVEEANKNINIITRTIGLDSNIYNERFKATLLPTIEDNPIHSYDDSFLTKINVKVLNDVINDVLYEFMQDIFRDHYYLSSKIIDGDYNDVWLTTMRKCTGKYSCYHFETYGYIIQKELIMERADRHK